MKKTYKPKELVQAIQEGGDKQDQAIRWIYSKSGWVNIVRKLISKLGGSSQDAADIIQEGLISFLMDVQKSKLNNPDGAKAYFIRSCKNIWLNQFNRNIRGQEIIEKELPKQEEGQNEEKIYHAKELWEQLDKILEQLGRRCKEVLKLWAMGYSHVEIAKLVNYENANVSKKTKSICIEKLKALGLNADDWQY
jgi:RNA polymerase sigma factor (sigma-70 family)